MRMSLRRMRRCREWVDITVAILCRVWYYSGYVDNRNDRNNNPSNVYQVELCNMEKQFEKWKEWLKHIRDDVEMLSEHQKIFSDIKQIVSNNQHLKNHRKNPFVRFLWNIYFGNTTITIRRQVKRNQDNSLVQLLFEIKNAPQLLTRQHFLDLFCSTERVEADIVFSQEFSGLDKDHINPEGVQNDLHRLKTLSKKVEDVADKRVAHHDLQPQKSDPDLKEVNECIDYLVELTKKYWFLFNGERIEEELLSLPDAWQEIFREPWIPTDNLSSIDPTAWWNAEGDKEWDEWSP